MQLQPVIASTQVDRQEVSHPGQAPVQRFAATQWCQPNMSSRAYAHGGVLVPSEAPVVSRCYQWYLGLMEEACRSTTG